MEEMGDRGQETTDKKMEAPQWLQEKLSQYKPSTPSEALNLIVHYIMTECDFQKTDSDGDGELPAGWKDRVSTFHYTNPTFPDFKCDLVLMTKKGLKQIMACFPQQDDDIDITINVIMKDYFKETVQSPITYDDFINVSQLVRTLRDKLLHPLQVCAHELLGVPAPWHLVGLPYELLIHMASLLTYRDVLKLSQTCHRLQSVMDDDRLWKTLYKRDFPKLYEDVDKTFDHNWKGKYKTAVIRRKKFNRLRENCHPIPGTSQPSIPHNPLPYQPFPFHPYPTMPRPRGDNPYPPQPHPSPNPFCDPNSPHFSGEIPPMPGAFPKVPPYPRRSRKPRRPSPRGPFTPSRPSPFRPFSPDPSFPDDPFSPDSPDSPDDLFQPPFYPPDNSRGPRFDYF